MRPEMGQVPKYEIKKEYYNEPVRPEMGEPYLSKNYYKNRYQTFFRIIFYLL